MARQPTKKANRPERRSISAVVDRSFDEALSAYCRKTGQTRSGLIVNALSDVLGRRAKDGILRRSWGGRKRAK